MTSISRLLVTDYRSCTVHSMHCTGHPAAEFPPS